MGEGGGASGPDQLLDLCLWFSRRKAEQVMVAQTGGLGASGLPSPPQATPPARTATPAQKKMPSPTQKELGQRRVTFRLAQHTWPRGAPAILHMCNHAGPAQVACVSLRGVVHCSALPRHWLWLSSAMREGGPCWPFWGAFYGLVLGKAQTPPGVPAGKGEGKRSTLLEEGIGSVYVCACV